MAATAREKMLSIDANKAAAAEWIQDNIESSHGFVTKRGEVYVNVYLPQESVEAFVASINGGEVPVKVAAIVEPSEYDDMTKKELLELADSLGLDLGKRDSNAKIIHAIQEAKAEKAEEAGD